MALNQIVRLRSFVPWQPSPNRAIIQTLRSICHPIVTLEVARDRSESNWSKPFGIQNRVWDPLWDPARGGQGAACYGEALPDKGARAGSVAGARQYRVASGLCGDPECSSGFNEGSVITHGIKSRVMDLLRQLPSTGQSQKVPASLLAWPGVSCGVLSARWGRMSAPLGTHAFLGRSSGILWGRRTPQRRPASMRAATRRQVTRTRTKYNAGLNGGPWIAYGRLSGTDPVGHKETLLSRRGHR